MSPPNNACDSAEEDPRSPDEVEDPDKLMELAVRYRTGSDGHPPDMLKCYECYVTAAALGHAEAQYAAALFLMAGGAVPQDIKEGASRLRAAADAGVTAAKVYLGNLYELGLHFRADPEKASVWYRSAARAAAIRGNPGTPEHDQALASLGCVRQVLALQGDETIPPEQRQAWLRKAKTLGYALMLRNEATARQPAPAQEIQSELDAGPDVVRVKSKASRKPAPKRRPRRASHAKSGMVAFLYSLLFAATGAGAAWGLRAAAEEAVQRGLPLPVVATRVSLILPAVAVLIGVLPGLLVFRFGAYAKGILVGAVLALGGWFAAGPFMPREGGALALGMVGYLLTMLVLGLMGGAKGKMEG